MMKYEKNVFINCPFDKSYRQLLEKLIFILSFYDFNVQMSATKSSAHDRLNEIVTKIKNSKYTFHDLSRHKALKKGEFSRFNMPFELGIDFGCYEYMRNRTDKVIAIIDSFPNEYDKHLSDLSGRDIIHHENDSERLFELIPNWLRANTGIIYDSPKRLKGYYTAWDFDYKEALKKHEYDINEIDLGVFNLMLTNWLPAWKLKTNYILPEPNFSS